MKTVYLKVELDAGVDHGANWLLDQLARVARESGCDGESVQSVSRVPPSEIVNEPSPAPAGIPRHHIGDLDTGKERLLEYVEEEMDIHEVAQAFSLFLDRDHVITVESSDAYYQGQRVVLEI